MKNNWFHIISLSAVFVLLTTRASSQIAIIKGIVKTGEEVLPAATISVGNKTTLTNYKGEFSVSVTPGNYLLTITYVGYKKFDQSVSIHSGQTEFLEINMIKDEQMGEAVILGSRSPIQRSNLNSAVPVDVIQSRNFSVSQVEINQILVKAVPSFHSPQQTVGFGAHIAPATLRGLNPDETLVLLNSRRRHNTAFIWQQAGLGYGTVGTDLNTIPLAAIETIEVLRDGASAQHGSDAIAGIINIVLKKSTGKTSINLQTGEYYKGDGETFLFSINRGILLIKKGFLNFTANYRFSNYTQRNGEYDSTVYYKMPYEIDSIRNLDNQRIAEREFSRRNHRPIGNPQTYNTALVLNGGYPLSSKTNFFWTGTLNYRISKDRASAAYRYPKDSLLYVNTALFPDGFQSRGLNQILDISGIAGVEGSTNKGWHWDWSSTYGGNSHHFKSFNTNNASQFADGKNAQTEFYIGTLLFTQNTNNINFTRDFSKNLHNVKSFSVSYGGEFRIDHFRIKEGEEASYKNYNPASGRIGGAQGSRGFSPDENAVNKSRYVSAGYAELEMDMNKKILWNLAGRYEHYSDFGGNLAGKLAMRYKFSDRFLLRGAINNGFRAPSMQQQYFSSTNQTGKFGVLYTNGTFRNDGDVAAVFGISALKAERSLNVGLGITSKISKNISLTIDAYWLRIKNRIIYSDLINDSLPEVRRILDNLGRLDIQAVRFFSNAISTHTKGLDFVLNSRWPIRRSLLEISLAANYNKTTVYGAIQSAKNLPDNEQYRNILFTREIRGRVEQAQPRDKIILTVNYTTGKLKFSTNHIRYGKIAQLFNNPAKNPDEFFSPKIVSGFSIRYNLHSWISLAMGAENVFNVYPDKIKNKSNTNSGIFIYSFNITQFGYNGGYYFVNMSFNF